jgi:hypothetical protein
MKYWLCLVVLSTVGCAGRRPVLALPDVRIPKESILEDVVLHGCDVTTSPPKCKSSSIKFRRGDEQIVIK